MPTDRSPRSSMREWGLEWIEGSIIGYTKDKALGNNKISLKNIIGRVERAMTSYGVMPEDIAFILDKVAGDTDILAWIPRKEKEKILRPIRETLALYTKHRSKT